MTLSIAAGAMASPGVASSSHSRQTLVVIGDSISADYNDRANSARRAWYSFLAARLHVTPVKYAERGSGYGRPGKRTDGTALCTGTTYADRLLRKNVRRAVRRARVVVLEGGVNDYRQCVRDATTGAWVLAPSDPAVVAAQIRLTMNRLAKLRKHRPAVYVIAPWGPRDNAAPAREWITSLLESESRKRHFQYVDVAHGTVDVDRTDDGIHPNRAGSQRIYTEMYRYSDIRRWKVS